MRNHLTCSQLTEAADTKYCVLSFLPHCDTHTSVIQCVCVCVCVCVCLIQMWLCHLNHVGAAAECQISTPWQQHKAAWLHKDDQSFRVKRQTDQKPTQTHLRGCCLHRSWTQLISDPVWPLPVWWMDQITTRLFKESSADGSKKRQRRNEMWKSERLTLDKCFKA